MTPEYFKNYNRVNYEKVSKQKKEYYQKTKSQHLEYYQRNKSLIMKRYYENRQSNLEKMKAYKRRNPQKMLGYNIKLYKKIGKVFDVSDKQFKSTLNMWSKTIKKRFDNICVVCGEVGNQAHHIFYKKHYPKLSLNVNNGVLLCKRCHDECHWRNCKIGS